MSTNDNKFELGRFEPKINVSANKVSAINRYTCLNSKYDEIIHIRVCF